jgi:hypothetical protein
MCDVWLRPKAKRSFSSSKGLGVTAYGSKTKPMIANDLNRHSRGDRHVKLNPDGTVTLHLSNDTRGKAEDTNFLPVPNEDF